MDDLYLVPAVHAHCEIKVNSSKFISQIFEITDEATVAEQIETVRRSMHDATHHCSAFTFGIEESVARFDDDGEPSGTAGLPILRRIEGAGLSNTLIVVTRYYGGTKLGTGGLMRAYGDAAQSVIAAAGAVERTITTTFTTEFQYDDTAVVMHLIRKLDGEIARSAYGQTTVLEFTVRRSQADHVASAFEEASGGRITVT